MIEKKRARRRRDVARIKARMRRYARHWGYPVDPTPKFVGREAARHWTHYPCWICGKKRRQYGPTIAEQRQRAMTRSSTDYLDD